MDPQLKPTQTVLSILQHPTLLFPYLAAIAALTVTGWLTFG